MKQTGKAYLVLLIIGFLFLPCSGIFAQEEEGDDYNVPTVAAHLGVDFFAWQTPFLVTGVDLHFQIQPALYALLGADFGIHVEDEGGEVSPSFLFPLRG